MGRDLTPDLTDVIRSAARQLTGFRRRRFQAQMTLRYCDGKPRRAEQVFGWGRDAVATGLGEHRTGIRCLDNVTARGRRKTEANHPELVTQIQALVEPHSQADPKFQTAFAYTRITVRSVHQHLLANAVGTNRVIPAERTIGDILNRLGYRLRRVRKTVPKKSCPPPTRSSTTCEPPTPRPKPIPKHSGSRSTPRPR